MVEHQRGEHAVKAAVGVREFVGEAAIELELELEPGASRLAAGAGERLGVGIEPDDLELRLDVQPGGPPGVRGWEQEAAAQLARFRAAAARDPADPQFAALIERLHAAS